MSLRDPGAIALLSCYELGHAPQGLASPLAFLESAGFRPAAFDLAIDELDEGAVARARLVGISVPMHTALRLGVRAARRVREIQPACRIVFYGLYASLNAEYLLDGIADAVLGGEYEETLVAFARAVDEGRAFEARPAPVVRRLAYPVPSRGGLAPPATYARLEDPERAREVDVGYVESSRGCKHGCLHCPIPAVYGRRFFAVPSDVVLADVRQQVAAGAGHITFGDPDFLNGPGHALDVARRLHAEFPEVTFDFTAKVEHIVRRAKDVGEHGRLGCIFIVSAVESLSDVVLRNLEKGHTRADVSKALAVARGAGIALRPSWVAFTPWSSLDDYLEILDFVEREDLVDAVDPVQYAVRLLVPPGSLLLRSPAMRPHLGALRPELLTYAWTHPDPRMDRLHAEVRAMVEAAALRGEDRGLTFGRVRERARALAERREPREALDFPPPARRRYPRLTEPWFC